MGLCEKLSVMVVDDMSVSRGLLIQALEEIGIRNTVYENDGHAALLAIQKKPVHVVISDYNMPEMDGLALLAALKKFGLKKKMGFILVTGTTNSAVISKGKELGMNNYLRKPFSVPQMRACLEAVVGPLA